MIFHIIRGDQPLLPEFLEVHRVAGRIDTPALHVRIRAPCVEIAAGDTFPVIVTYPETDALNAKYRCIGVKDVLDSGSNIVRSVLARSRSAW